MKAASMGWRGSGARLQILVSWGDLVTLDVGIGVVRKDRGESWPSWLG